jgi:hypothetical protein
VPACADGLLGSSLGWQYYGGPGAYNPGGDSATSGTFTDNGGVGGTFVDLGGVTVFNIDADDMSITFDYSVDQTVGPWSTDTSLALAPTIYAGIAIDLLSAGAFASVTIDQATNMVDFDGSDLSFSGNQIQVNWGALDFTASTIVRLDVSLQDSVATAPEPATGVLAAISLLTAVFARRRKLTH